MTRGFFPGTPSGVVVSATDGATGPVRASSPFPPRQLFFVRALFLGASASLVAESRVILFDVRLPCSLHTRRCPVGNRVFRERVPHELPERGLSLIAIVIVLFAGCRARRTTNDQANKGWTITGKIHLRWRRNLTRRQRC